MYPGAEGLMFSPMLIHKATDAQLQKASDSGDYFGQLKKDGALYMFVKGHNGEKYLFGRTTSKITGLLTEKSANVPHIMEYLDCLPNGTILLGEIYYPGGTSRNVTTIMGCKEEKAVERQNGSYGFIHYYIYDCLSYDSKLLLNVGNFNRYKVLLKIVEKFNLKTNEYVEIAEAWEDNLYERVGEALANGEEGMVLKKKDAPYEPSKRPLTNLKAKQVDFADVVVIGFNDPTKEYTGKELVNWEYWINPETNELYPTGLHYEKSLENGAEYAPVTKHYYNGWKNAIEIGAYDKDGHIVSIGTIASGLNDELRKDFAENPSEYLNKVCMIQCMSKDNQAKTIRHGFFVQFREDKDQQECKLDDIFS
jgi:ATP-dependent DNA ligase